MASVHVRSWQVGYRGLLPQADLDAMRPEQRAERFRFDPADTDPASPSTHVAVDDDDLVLGLVTTSRPDPAERVGLLMALYVDPPHWRTGVGSQLLDHAHRRLAEVLRVDEAVLWVLVGNERAATFYRHHGWEFDGGTQRDVVWGVAADERRMRRRIT